MLTMMAHYCAPFRHAGHKMPWHHMHHAAISKGFGPKPKKNPARKSIVGSGGGGDDGGGGGGGGGTRNGNGNANLNVMGLPPLDPMDPMTAMDPMDPPFGQFNWWGGDLDDGTPVFLLEGDHFCLGPAHTGTSFAAFAGIYF